jgi:nitrate/TMAO reductase-like tetraheme cytochrome c subunit
LTLRVYSFVGALFVGLLSGLLIWGSYEGVTAMVTTNAFCTSCHEMQGVADDYRHSIHFTNPAGVRAQCADCHVPKPFVARVVHMIGATRDLIGHATGVIDTPAKFDAHRLEMARRVWGEMTANDSLGCRGCHSFEAMDFANQRPKAALAMHGPMQPGASCIDCHRGIAHRLVVPVVKVPIVPKAPVAVAAAPPPTLPAPTAPATAASSPAASSPAASSPAASSPATPPSAAQSPAAPLSATQSSIATAPIATTPIVAAPPAEAPIAKTPGGVASTTPAPPPAASSAAPAATATTLTATGTKAFVGESTSPIAATSGGAPFATLDVSTPVLVISTEAGVAHVSARLWMKGDAASSGPLYGAPNGFELGHLDTMPPGAAKAGATIDGWTPIDLDGYLAAEAVTATLESVWQAAESNYEFLCAGCHVLHAAEAYTPAQWDTEMTTMAKSAHLQPDDAMVLLKWLQTTSLASHQDQPSPQQGPATQQPSVTPQPPAP